MTNEISPPNCPVCRFAKPTPFSLKHPEATLYRCSQCDHAFSDIRTIEKIEDYSPEYFEKTHKRWFENPNYSLFSQIGDLIQQYNPIASVIDVGCGRGDFLKYLHQKFKKLSLTGIDLSQNSPSEGIHFEQADFLTTNLPQTYDVVVSLLVIEHVTDIHLFVERMRKLCHPGGLIIITTNNDRGTTYAMARLLAHLGVNVAFNRLYSKHHLNHFSHHSLKKLAEIHGLNVQKLIHHTIPMAAVDMPATSKIMEFFFRIATKSLFILGSLLKRNFLQTIICIKSEKNNT